LTEKSPGKKGERKKKKKNVRHRKAVGKVGLAWRTEKVNYSFSQRKKKS